jgi:hypothetical protein
MPSPWDDASSSHFVQQPDAAFTVLTVIQRKSKSAGDDFQTTATANLIQTVKIKVVFFLIENHAPSCFIFWFVANAPLLYQLYIIQPDWSAESKTFRTYPQVAQIGEQIVVHAFVLIYTYMSQISVANAGILCCHSKPPANQNNLLDEIPIISANLFLFTKT